MSAGVANEPGGLRKDKGPSVKESGPAAHSSMTLAPGLRGRKRKKGPSSGVTIDRDDDDGATPPTRSPDQVREEMRRYLESVSESRASVCRQMGVAETTLRRFLDPEKNGDNPGQANFEGNAVHSAYLAALRFLAVENDGDDAGKSSLDELREDLRRYIDSTPETNESVIQRMGLSRRTFYRFLEGDRYGGNVSAAMNHVIASFLAKEAERSSADKEDAAAGMVQDQVREDMKSYFESSSEPRPAYPGHKSPSDTCTKIATFLAKERRRREGVDPDDEMPGGNSGGDPASPSPSPSSVSPSEGTIYECRRLRRELRRHLESTSETQSSVARRAGLSENTMCYFMNPGNYPRRRGFLASTCKSIADFLARQRGRRREEEEEMSSDSGDERRTTSDDCEGPASMTSPDGVRKELMAYIESMSESNASVARRMGMDVTTLRKFLSPQKYPAGKTSFALGKIAKFLKEERRGEGGTARKKGTPPRDEDGRRKRKRTKQGEAVAGEERSVGGGGATCSWRSSSPYVPRRKSPNLVRVALRRYIAESSEPRASILKRIGLGEAAFQKFMDFALVPDSGAYSAALGLLSNEGAFEPLKRTRGSPPHVRAAVPTKRRRLWTKADMPPAPSSPSK